VCSSLAAARRSAVVKKERTKCYAMGEKREKRKKKNAKVREKKEIYLFLSSKERMRVLSGARRKKESGTFAAS